MLLRRSSATLDQLKPETVKDINTFKNVIILELASISAQERDLNGLVQNALQPRAPQGSEVGLLQLVRSIPNQQTDLRELIMRLMDQGSKDVDLNTLMKDLEFLFQKNQIAIRISLLQT